MSLITQDIPTLTNGVSQQPDVLRLPSQANGQLNCQSSVIYGLTRRAPTRHIAKVSDGSFDSAFFHIINRDSTERYAVVITDGDIKAFDLITGVARLVDAPLGKAYLTASNPRASFKAVTAADYTFIVNRSSIAGMTAETSPAVLPEALLSFYAVQYKERFVVSLDGVSCTFNVPGSATVSGASNTEVLNTNDTAAAVHSLLLTTFPTGWTFTLSGSNVMIRRADGADFTIKTEDSAGGTHLKAHKGVVQNFTDLPKTGIDGFKIKVIGTPSDPGADYWVQYQVTTAPAPVVEQPTGSNPGTEPPVYTGKPWLNDGEFYRVL